jgi:pimeloyl-ACP methyl ester carboxylesterase
MKNLILYFGIITFILFFGASEAHAQTPLCPGDPIQISVLDTVELSFEPPPIDTSIVQPNPPNGLGDKIIFWVHGLGGDETSWERAAVVTEHGGETAEWDMNHSGWNARQANCIRPKYTELSMGGASATLQGKMLAAKHINISNETDPKENFIIAHSQGGLVARHLWKRYAEANSTVAEEDQMFGGIVTFGTAHQGAQIINNTVPASEGGPDLGDAFADGACTELAVGPVTEGVETNFFLDIITTRSGIEESLTNTCEGLSGLAIRFLLSDFTAGITDDYMVGSPTIDELNVNDAQNPLPKVTFYGIEDDTDNDLVWRIMSSLSEEHDLPNKSVAFEANEDGALMEDVIELMSDYIAKQEAWAMQAEFINEWTENIVPCSWWEWTIFPTVCGLYDHQYYEAIAIRDGYKRGREWLATANTKYQIVMGGVKVVPTPTFSCDCDGTLIFEDVLDPDFCTGLGCTAVANGGIKFVLERRRSDGIVLEESASNYPGAEHSVELFGSNHQQMRNDRNTERALLELFGIGYGDFFEVLPK